MAVAAEALAFSVKKGMDLDAVMAVILSGAAYSYVAKDRKCHGLNDADLRRTTDAYGASSGIFSNRYLGQGSGHCPGRGEEA